MQQIPVSLVSSSNEPNQINPIIRTGTSDSRGRANDGRLRTTGIVHHVSDGRTTRIFVRETYQWVNEDFPSNNSISANSGGEIVIEGTNFHSLAAFDPYSSLLELRSMMLLNSIDLLIPSTIIPLDRSYQKDVTVDETLNKEYFLNDPTILEWNNLTLRNGDIANNEWNFLQSSIEKMFTVIYFDGDKKYFRNFFNACLKSADAQTDEGKQIIQCRLEAIINYLLELNQYSKIVIDNNEKVATIEIIREAFRIIEEGGMKCADRAIVFLIYLENFIKLTKNPQYMANVLIQIFKLEAIKIVINKQYNENLESFLYYVIKFNNVLGLGQSERFDKMLYEFCANAEEKSDSEILKDISCIFTLDDLLNFTFQQLTFIRRFESEMEKDLVVLEARAAYCETGDEEDLKKAEKAKDGFYREKALKLFGEASFLKN